MLAGLKNHVHVWMMEQVLVGKRFVVCTEGHLKQTVIRLQRAEVSLVLK